MNWKKLKFWKTNEYKFPCINCFVRPICNLSKSCDKLELNENKLKDLFSKYKCCVDCGSKKFIEGPSGGMITNFKCAGCGHWFNMALPLFIQRIRMP